MPLSKTVARYERSAKEQEPEEEILISGRPSKKRCQKRQISQAALSKGKDGYIQSLLTPFCENVERSATLTAQAEGETSKGQTKQSIGRDVDVEEFVWEDEAFNRIMAQMVRDSRVNGTSSTARTADDAMQTKGQVSKRRSNDNTDRDIETEDFDWQDEALAQPLISSAAASLPTKNAIKNSESIEVFDSDDEALAQQPPSVENEASLEATQSVPSMWAVSPYTTASTPAASSGSSSSGPTTTCTSRTSWRAPQTASEGMKHRSQQSVNKYALGKWC